MKRIEDYTGSKLSLQIEEDWNGDILAWDVLRYSYSTPKPGWKQVRNFIFEADLEMNTEKTFKDCVCVQVVGNPDLTFNMYAGDFAKAIDNAKNNKYGFKLLDGVSFGFSGRFYFNFARKYVGISPVKK